MDWKEVLALQFRKLTIDEDVISRAMKNFVDSFKSSLDKYNIHNIEVSSDLSKYIEIKSYKKILVSYGESEVTFALCNENGFEDDIFIRLSIVEKIGNYLIENINTKEHETKLKAFIDEGTIDEIFQDLFRLNRETTNI